MKTRLILEVNAPGWKERREFASVAAVVDYLAEASEDPAREQVAGELLRGVLTPEEEPAPAPRGTARAPYLRAV